MQDRNAQKYKNKGIVQDILAQIKESYLDSRKENYEMNDILLFTKIGICGILFRQIYYQILRCYGYLRLLSNVLNLKT